MTLITALGLLPVAGARAADAAGSEPAWTQPAPAPLSPRWNASVAALSPETMLVFGGDSFGASGWVAGQPFSTGKKPALDAAVLNLRTGAWTTAAPLPAAGTALIAPSGDHLRARGPVGSDGFAYAMAGERILRYDAAGDRWDAFGGLQRAGTVNTTTNITVRLLPAN